MKMFSRLNRPFLKTIKSLQINLVRCYPAANCAPTVTGVVLGVYDTPDGTQEFTEAAEKVNERSNGYLSELLKQRCIPQGKSETFSYLGIPGFVHVVLVGLGCRNPNKQNNVEQLNEEKENIRVAMAAGARSCQDEGCTRIMVDGATSPEAAAEGAILATYKYNADKSNPAEKAGPMIELFDHPDTNAWASGEINAECQNWARYLSHSPSNLKKPQLLAAEIIDKLCKFDIRVDMRNRDWMALRKMHSSLSLTKGSCDKPLLLEIGYCGGSPKERPVVLVGKGNICDSGGLFLKPYKGIHEYRADMAGAAAICATFQAVARKRLPINIRGALLLYENMPSPMGLKPGDMIKDKHGTHIRITDPDNDCRVVLSDIVNFTDYFSPMLIINVGTFSKSIAQTLGVCASGAFTRSTSLWNEIQRAGLESGDRVWRMPIWKHFRNLSTDFPDVDMDNNSCETGGDTCQAAAFLQEFVPVDQNCCCPDKIPYLHIDCFGTGLEHPVNDIEPYYRKGIKMGRPTRLLTQFLYHRACLLPKTRQATDSTAA